MTVMVGSASNQAAPRTESSGLTEHDQEKPAPHLDRGLATGRPKKSCSKQSDETMIHRIML